MVTNTLKIMRATMLLSANSIGVGVNVRLVGYGLSVSRYQGIFRENSEIHRGDKQTLYTQHGSRNNR